MLASGGCAVSSIPRERWPLERHGHPRTQAPGRSYTWSAGVLPDIWGFDPAVFGVSPREALQMDPQQRLLLELAFEACEDAGFPPSRLAGTQTGVYVGASALDYSTIGLHDPAIADAYYRDRQHAVDRRQSALLYFRFARSELDHRYGLLVLARRAP